MFVLVLALMLACSRDNELAADGIRLDETSDSSVVNLAPLLKDTSESVRHEAAAALGKMGGSGVTTLKQARVSNNWLLREAALHGLAPRPLSTEDRRTYLAVGLGDPYANVRLSALDLFKGAPVDEVPDLAKYVEKALDDAEPVVREAAQSLLNKRR
jgi:HEAT repeat protein